MARHDQRPRQRQLCGPCSLGLHGDCVEFIRIVLGMHDRICQCRVKECNGEPLDKQILDPDTGDVYVDGGGIIHGDTV